MVLYFLRSAQPEPTALPTPIPTPSSTPTATSTSTAPQEDVTPPELTGITIEQSEIDTGAGAGHITVSMQATDGLLGIAYVELAFESPLGEQEERASSGVPTTGHIQ